MKFASLLFLCIIVVFSSCSSLHIEKRHYRNGFYFGRTNSENQDNAGEAKINDQAQNEKPSAPKSDSAPVRSDTSNVENHNEQPTPVEPVGKSNGGIIANDNSSQTQIEQLPPDEDPVERQINKTRVLGTLALALIIVGLLGLEVSAYFFPLLLIGIGCAIFGLKIGKNALLNTKYKVRDKDGNVKPNEKRIRAKRAYWLCLSSILIVMGYVLIRFVILAGLSTVAISFTLLGICLALFLLFKMGVFSDLAD